MCSNLSLPNFRPSLNSELVPMVEPAVWLPSAGFLPGDDEDHQGDYVFFVVEESSGRWQGGWRGRLARRQMLWEAWTPDMRWLVRARARDHWRAAYHRCIIFINPVYGNTGDESINVLLDEMYGLELVINFHTKKPLSSMSRVGEWKLLYLVHFPLP